MRHTNQIPTPAPGEEVEWVRQHLGALTAEGRDGVVASTAFRGGQAAADRALATLDITGYARARNEVWPPQRRGASRLSPYIRYGLITLPDVWHAVADASSSDRTKYRDELMWQEYARHVYARLGPELGRSLRHEPPSVVPMADPWNDDMACMSLVTAELERDGWLVNQTRMWLASQWTVRGGRDWRQGEDRFFTHLLDGSRAANRVGWQWTVGTGTGKPYEFSRWQVRKRAPGLCGTCALRHACPVEDWPDAQPGPTVAPPERLRHDRDPATTAGPSTARISGDPDAVWLTFESLGDADPALSALSALPAVVVFDVPLLARLRLSGKRLVFLAETIADLATRRVVEVYAGDPVEVLVGRPVAVTYAPVPGFGRRARAIAPVQVHPWPWLIRPGSGSLASFTAWRRSGEGGRSG